MTYLIDQWHKPSRVLALQTTKNFASNNQFDLHPKQQNKASIQQLVSTFNLPHNPFFLQQVHGSQVVEYMQAPKRQFDTQADACFTRQSHIVCAVMTADCLPVLMTDSEGSFVAAIHCGWRSLYDNILHKTLQAINTEHDVICWFGPCIQQPQYEVNEAFKQHYLNQHPSAVNAFTPIINGHCFADLYQLAELQLEAWDVKINQSHECTFSNSNYHSWRQDQSKKRMASMVWLDSKQ